MGVSQCCNRPPKFIGSIQPEECEIEEFLEEDEEEDDEDDEPSESALPQSSTVSFRNLAVL